MSKTGTKEWATDNKNIYIGCAHGCRYCYARYNAVDRFHTVRNAQEWLEMKLHRGKFEERPKKCEGRIMFPTQHDILPEHIDATIEYLKGWLKAGNEILIVSKPHLDCIRKICDQLEDFKGQIVFRFTIGSYNDDVLKFWEPHAPGFEERVAALHYAFSRGFQTSVSCEPYLDNEIIALVDALLPWITDTIWVGKMNAVRNRVDTKGWSKEDFKYLDRVLAAQTAKFIWAMYEHLKDNPKVKWKDSIKKVVGLPEEEIG